MRLVPDSIWGVLTVYGEARGEIHDGKIAVANVIRNRVARKYTSDGTVAGTVLAKYQFSCWNHDDPNRLVMAKADLDDSDVVLCQQAWLDSATINLVGHAVLYLNKAIVHPLPSWARSDREVATIGSHTFYTDP